MRTKETETFRRKYRALPGYHQQVVQEAIGAFHESGTFPPLTLSTHPLTERLSSFWSVDHLEPTNDWRMVVKPIKDGVLLVNTGYHDTGIYR